MSGRPVFVAVHGGAGRVPKAKTRPPGRAIYDDGVARALRSAQAVLLKGGSATRAVTEAVAVLEDDEIFNAGRGAALCVDGTVELSASIMSGHNMKVGAMVGLKRTRNPIRAARALMGHSHCLLFGAHGDTYAREAGAEEAARDYFMVPARLKQWKRMKSRTLALDHSVPEDAHGTVGAVALDRRGRLAAATSTGGLLNQLAGRVGDTPVIGAGTWANHVCAVSATGTGDAFARIAFARRVSDLIELSGLAPGEAAARALAEVEAVGGVGGCLVLTASGAFACPFNTREMIRGWASERELPQAAILPDEGIVPDQ